jgi:hypothetical protein
MSGSYLHVTNSDASFRGLDLIENLGDAYEAIEEMHNMIAWLADRVAGFDRSLDTPKAAIHAAWRYGHPRPPENTADESLAGYEAFWSDD